MRTKPCAKMAVDWVLMGAFKYVKHIPNIKLSGAVKTCLQQKWGSIFETAYKERKMNEEDCSFNWNEEFLYLWGSQNLVWDVPECRCPASCYPRLKPKGLLRFDADDSWVDEEEVEQVV